MAYIFAATSLIGGGATALDAIDGNDLSDGDAATVITDAGTYHYHLDASSGASENSPYVISPDDNAGTKRWLLMAPVGPMSHVRAQRTTALTFAHNTLVTFAGLTEDYDYLSEFNATTGVFTAIYAGLYVVSMSLLLDDVVHSSLGSYVDIEVNINSGTTIYKARTGSPVDDTLSGYPSGKITTTVELAASDTLKCEAKQFSNSSIDTIGAGAYNWLTIDRIA